MELPLPVYAQHDSFWEVLMMGWRMLSLAICVSGLGVSLGTAGQTRAAQSSGAAADYRLSVDGEVDRPLKLSAADLTRLKRRTARATDHDGKEALFEGVSLADVLGLAGVTFGEGLRGKNLALFLVVEATDGYRVVFALPELDPAFTDRVILLAWSRGGAPLTASEGPLRIVVPGEKRQARWVRQVVSLTIKRA